MRAAAWAIGFGLALPAGSFAQVAAPPPQGCTSAESRQFDFWVGRWDVYAAADPSRKVAESVIEKLYGGCAIRENWRPGGNGGGSLSAYVAADRGWRQTWVDSSASWVEFRGGLRGAAMVLQGVWAQPDKPTQIMRMTYTVLDGGAVRQLGETSDDGGSSWQPSFDFVYRQAPPG